MNVTSKINVVPQYVLRRSMDFCVSVKLGLKDTIHLVPR